MMENLNKDFGTLLEWVERNPVDATHQIQQLSNKITAYEEVIVKLGPEVSYGKRGEMRGSK